MATRTQLLVRFGVAAVAAGAALFVSIEFKADAPARWREAGSISSDDAPPGQSGSGFGSPSGRLSAPIREDLEPADQFDYPLTER